MPLFKKKQMSLLAAEFVVVVLGILIAFQVEEWREGRQEAEEIRASLLRLAEETTANIALCE